VAAAERTRPLMAPWRRQSPRDWQARCWAAAEETRAIEPPVCVMARAAALVTANALPRLVLSTADHSDSEVRWIGLSRQRSDAVGDTIDACQSGSTVKSTAASTSAHARSRRRPRVSAPVSAARLSKPVRGHCATRTTRRAMRHASSLASAEPTPPVAPKIAYDRLIRYHLSSCPL
jgi:hypothetical protein